MLDLAMPAGAGRPGQRRHRAPAVERRGPLFRARAVLFATGGFGKMFKVTSNAHTLTGDGVAIAYRRGLPLEDMEFFQFHPTGMYKLGFLLSEAMRGEGGFLVNGKGERFMERYAPTMKDLASRDVVSRSIYQEIAAGRGIDGKDFVHLDVRHLGAKVLNEKLPDMSGFIRTYFGLDPLTELVPIQPTAHYAMGGIPTDVDGRVLADETGRVVPGFYAAGECACVSVHGANRLGTNSLLDILVFGRRAGIAMADEVRRARLPGADPAAEASVKRRDRGAAGTDRWRAPGGHPRGAAGDDVREVRRLPDRRAADAGGDEVDDLRDRARAAGRCEDKGSATTPTSARRWSSASCSTAPRRRWRRRWPAPRAAARTRARTIPDRDDVNWLKHTFAFRWSEGGRDWPTGRRRSPTSNRSRGPTDDGRPAARSSASTPSGTTPRTGRSTPSAEPIGPGARPAAPGEVVPGRDAHLPALVRPRRLRLRRDADQRPQPAGLRVPGQGRGPRRSRVEPVRGSPVVKDLLVDIDGFWEKYR